MKLFLSILTMLTLVLASCSTSDNRNADVRKMQKKDLRKAYSNSSDDYLDSDDLDAQEDIDEELVNNDVYDDMDDFDGQNRVIASYSDGPGETISYTIEKNDTLMIISFKVYGDYSKWKEILDLNPEINARGLVVGGSVSLNKPEKQFIWEPIGNPYIVQEGDTLGSISNDKYGTTKRWREIFDNNRPLIKDPNLIFTGFTLYYKSSEGDLAYNIH